MTKEEFIKKYNADTKFKELCDKKISELSKGSSSEDLVDDDLEKVSGGNQDDRMRKSVSDIYRTLAESDTFMEGRPEINHNNIAVNDTLHNTGLPEDNIFDSNTRHDRGLEPGQ